MTDVVILTEYPGKTDLVTRQLLSGETGRIFWDAWGLADCSELSFEILSVLPRRPMSGKIEDFCLPKKEAESKALAAGWKYNWSMMKQGKWLDPSFAPDVSATMDKIKEINPKIVLSLGALANWLMTGSAKVMNVRGTIAEGLLGLKTLSTYPPSTIMRDWSLRPILISDLQK